MSQRINTTPAPPNVVPSAATTHIQGAASEHPPAIQRLPRNERGRDFVIGDLHGCFDELMLLMQHVRFDMTVDRLIAVGDLVDRGPRPRDCLE